MDPGGLKRSLTLLLAKLRQLPILKPPLAQLPICTEVAVETLCSPQASALYNKPQHNAVHEYVSTPPKVEKRCSRMAQEAAAWSPGFL